MPNLELYGCLQTPLVASAQAMDNAHTTTSKATDGGLRSEACGRRPLRGQLWQAVGSGYRSCICIAGTKVVTGRLRRDMRSWTNPSTQHDSMILSDPTELHRPTG